MIYIINIKLFIFLSHCALAFLCVKPDVVSYTTVMRGLGRAGEWTRVLEILRTLISLGIEPNGYTYGAAIDACAKVKATHALKWQT